MGLRGIPETEPLGEMELGLDSLIDKYGLEKVTDALARKKQ